MPSHTDRPIQGHRSRFMNCGDCSSDSSDSSGDFGHRNRKSTLRTERSSESDCSMSFDGSDCSMTLSSADASFGDPAPVSGSVEDYVMESLDETNSIPAQESERSSSPVSDCPMNMSCSSIDEFGDPPPVFGPEEHYLIRANRDGHFLRASHHHDSYLNATRIRKYDVIYDGEELYDTDDEIAGFTPKKSRKIEMPTDSPPSAEVLSDLVSQISIQLKTDSVEKKLSELTIDDNNGTICEDHVENWKSNNDGETSGSVETKMYFE